MNACKASAKFVNVHVHESQRVDQNGPKIVGVGIVPGIDVLVNIYRIMKDVILDNHRTRLHAAQRAN